MTGRALSLALAILFAAGCSSAGRTNTLAAGVLLGAGALIPSGNIEQVYYLGVIDPIEQVPEAIYRVRVRGQASAISNMSFGSGWVPAAAIDSLNARAIGTGASKNKWLPADCDAANVCVPKTGRRLVQFGPEGFREAPADHRLVIIMGADPSKFFRAVDQVLGAVADVKLEKDNADLRKELNTALLSLRADQSLLKAVQLRTLEEGLKIGEGLK